VRGAGRAHQENAPHSCGADPHELLATNSLKLVAHLTLQKSIVSGGLYGGGVVFELSPLPGGVWADSILYNFGRTGDGAGAASEVVFAPTATFTALLSSAAAAAAVSSIA
jgi:hypothetical protein